MTQSPPPAGSSPQPNQPPTRRGMSTGAKIGLGCGVAALVCVFICAGGVWWTYSNARRLASGAVTSIITTAINDSNLSAEQKQRLVERVSDLKDRYDTGQITMQQLGRVAEELAESPLLYVGMVMFAEQHYIATSSLSDQEKEQARRTLDRFARGLHEEEIDPQVIDHVTDPIATTDAQGNRQLKEHPTDDELRTFLARAREEADNADVPDEPFEVDLADEFDRAVERALQERVSDAESGSGNLP
ncbi:MAG: hypothetical protein ACODAQ_01465 [Phycisphaeraceae bacterium]